MLNGSRLFSLRKVPIHAHWSVWLMVTLVAMNLGAAGGVLVAIAGAFGFVTSILLHEMGHALTARRFGVDTQKITLWGLGGVAQLSGESPTPRAEGWIAVAGPAVSAVLAAIGIGGWFALDAAGVGGIGPEVVLWLGLMNGILAAFNMLPGAPLDGGRVVAAWRWGRHGDRYRARDEAGQAGQVVGSIVVGVGIWLMLRDLGSLLIPLTGLFIAMNAYAERRGAAAARRLEGLTVQDLTWYGVAQASAETDAETMWWQRGRLGGAGAVAVTDQEGHITGMVVEERLKKVPEQLRPMTRLAQLMVPFNALAQADEKEPLVSAIMRIHPNAPVITVWREGRLVGVVPAERVRQQLSAE